MRWREDEPNFQRLRQRRNGSGYQRRKGEAFLARANAVQAAHDNGCKKFAYANKADAEAHIARANSSRRGLRRQLQSAYRCPHCGAWHMTSQRRG